MATIDAIKEVLSENLDIDPATVTPDSTLDSLGIDSLDLVEMTVDLEEKLDIEFDETEGIKTIGEMAAYIDSLM
ncbi:acyl carrier protein [Curtanaerobium respiraculi]|uniref:acyl carrier protein n=1 Tax=Curtanaerobium respiraculi TaxID=2949669 RepID=UPI0024B36C3B|nr:acyl carrier protein [Curtanaerobium respiraculi]